MNHLRLRLAHARCLSSLGPRRTFIPGLVQRDLAQKYADKLKQRAEESGAKDVDELRERVRRELEEEKVLERAKRAKIEVVQHEQGAAASGSSPPTSSLKIRKDSSPIKPLDTILNISKLLFASPPLTPAQLEYKHRQSFAAPHLALTFYTDLTASHGSVLLRGEITPAQQGEGRWMLSQAEAQALVVAMQRFYLPGNEEAEKLLRCFHERPEKFKWEKLLELSDIGVKL
ncbi:hypothetical protein FRC08_018205 [Ceratobasidium sp. 394]|nr:hypothetical protein FRC08_018205 [Ceratobasidium sp. 394]